MRSAREYVLARAWPHHRLFYFLATDMPPALNLRELCARLTAWSGVEIPGCEHPESSWPGVLHALHELAFKGPLVVVLDEFPHICGTGLECLRELRRFWDLELGSLPLLMVLTGSDPAALGELATESSPLAGCIDWRGRIGQLDYGDAARLLPGRSHREAATLYGIVGGTPDFLDAVGGPEPWDEAVRREVLAPQGRVHLQMRNLLTVERGIRKPTPYHAVLAAMAEGHAELNAITDRAGLTEKPYVARRALETLEEMGWVGRGQNLDARRNSAIRHRIIDPAIRFWFRFVYPNRGPLAQSGPAETWSESVRPGLGAYMQDTLADLLREAYIRYHTRWNLPRIERWTRWSGTDRAGEPLTLDMVAETADGRLLTGAVAWEVGLAGSELHLNHRSKLERLAAAGHAWVYNAIEGTQCAGWVYLSASGFTDEFRELAAASERLTLLTLEDLYSPDPN